MGKTTEMYLVPGVGLHCESTLYYRQKLFSMLLLPHLNSFPAYTLLSAAI